MQLEISLTDESHAVIIPGMAYLFKSRTINKKTGKSYRSKKWFGRWKTAEGQWLSRSLSEDKKTAKKMLLKLCTAEEIESIYPSHRKESMVKLIDRFCQGIESSATPDYARMVRYRVNAVVKKIGVTHPDQIEPNKVTLAAAELAPGLRTRNHYTGSMKQFCRWLVDNGHAKRNPVSQLKPAKFEADKRYVRRALTRDEWDRLVNATVNSGRSFRGLTGNDRLMLYIFVLSTGWRAGGIAQLRAGDFGKDGLVTLQARYSKNRREQRKFLPDSVRKTLQGFLQDRPAIDRAWPGTWAEDAAEMLRIDLAAAGIKHKTEEGIIDFHSFRNTSITWLLESGTPIYLVQRHADHASPAQTMRYARPKRDNVDDAIEKTFSHIISLKSTSEIKSPKNDNPAISPIICMKQEKAHGRTCRGDMQ